VDPGIAATDGTGMAASPESLADCLGRLGLPANSTPLLVDSALFEGQDTGIVVSVGTMDAAGEPTALHVVAVGMDCTDDDIAQAQHWDLPLAATP
jgi:hypothetical protein